jgi:hypothetical protein
MRGRGVAVVVVMAALALLVIAAPASAKTHWLCKPGTNASFCAPSLSITVFSTTGDVLGVRNIKRDKDPKYDCFYVYPTVSDQQTQTANFTIDPEEKSIVLYQAARYMQHCRLFAPVYRQLTLLGIGIGGGSASNTRPPPFVYYSTFDEPPPPTAIFGRTTQPGDEVPAALTGGSAPLTPIFPSAPFAPGTTIGDANQLIGIPRPDVPTTWISAPNAYESMCQDAGGADFMQVGPLRGAPMLNEIPDANWGLHLTDANIALGNNARLVQQQFRAYERKNAAK